MKIIAHTGKAFVREAVAKWSRKRTRFIMSLIRCSFLFDFAFVTIVTFYLVYVKGDATVERKNESDNEPGSC